MLIPQGLDSRDSQGFIMNRQRNTSSLNLTQSYDGTTSPESASPYVDLVDEAPLTYVDDANKSYVFWMKRHSKIATTGVILGNSGDQNKKFITVANNEQTSATIHLSLIHI